MASKYLILFAFVSTIGMIVWVATPIEIPFFNPKLNSQNVDDRSQSTELTDRDSAAEEVRAVAAKITNIEQIIADGQSFAHSERERMRQNFQAMLDELQHQTRTPDHAAQQNLEQSILSLSYRVDSIDQRFNSLQTPDLPLPSDGQSFSWHYSVDEDSMLFQGNSEQILNTSLSPELVFDSQFKESKLVLESEDRKPHYTIPPTTTLLSSTALTALVGRVPVRGRLEDPWRFKLITGTENLASNGHRIPEVSGMLWSGTARGDYALSCVSGTVDTVAFIFHDGTIRTVHSESRGTDLNTGLGWISDERGNPCISGELKSNALQFLAQSTLVGSTAATARAIADAQTFSNTNSAGSTTESLTGDIDNFLLGRATEQALSEVSEWLTERQQSIFDAVYIPAGQPVAIHVEKPILIDYETDGRKVKTYDYATTNTSSKLGWLD